jgi:hypothetical protein
MTFFSVYACKRLFHSGPRSYRTYLLSSAVANRERPTSTMGRSDYSTGGETRRSNRSLDRFSVADEEARCSGSEPQRGEEDLSDTVGSEQTDSDCDEVAFQLYSVFDTTEESNNNNNNNHEVVHTKTGKRTEWQSSWFASKAEIAYQFEFLKSLAPKRRQQQSLPNVSDHTLRTSNNTRSSLQLSNGAFEPEPILESYDAYDSQDRSSTIYRTDRREGGTSRNPLFANREVHRADAHLGYEAEHDYEFYAHKEEIDHEFEQLRRHSLARTGYNNNAEAYGMTHEMYSERASQPMEQLQRHQADNYRNGFKTDHGMYESPAVTHQFDQLRRHSNGRTGYETHLEAGLYPVLSEIDSQFEHQMRSKQTDATTDYNVEHVMYGDKLEIDHQFEQLKDRTSAMREINHEPDADYNSWKNPRVDSFSNGLYPFGDELESQIQQLMRLSEGHLADLEHDGLRVDKMEVNRQIEEMRARTADLTPKNVASTEYSWRNPRTDAQPLPRVELQHPQHHLHNDSDNVMQGRTTFFQYRPQESSNDGKDELDREFNRLRTRTRNNMTRQDAVASIPQQRASGNSPLSPPSAAALERRPQSRAPTDTMISPRADDDDCLRATKAQIANQFDQLRSKAADLQRKSTSLLPSSPLRPDRPFQLFNQLDGEGPVEGALVEGASPAKAEIQSVFDQLRTRARMAQNGATALPAPVKNEIENQFAQLRTRSRNASSTSRSAGIVRFRRPTRPGAVFVPWGGRGPPPATLNTMARLPSVEDTVPMCPEQLSAQQIADQEPVPGTSSTHEAPQEQTEPDDLSTIPAYGGHGLETAPELVWTPKPHSYKRWALPLLALLVLAVIGTGVGVGVSRRRSSSSSFLPTTAMAPPTTSCSEGMKQIQPNVVTQCACNDTIRVVADDIALAYVHLLSQGFVTTLLPGFNATLKSCEPFNQALVWLASATGMPANEARRTQRYALALLFIYWKGEEWTSSKGWLSSSDECTWAGVSCNDDHEVEIIDLSNNNLQGVLSSGIGFLTNLNSLSLSNNALKGTLPTDLAKLSLLQTFILSSNSLSGSIPSEVGQMSQLTSFALDFNSLVGTLPTELGLLSRLLSLSISTNELHGSIPTELGLLQSLRGVSFQANALTGNLPTEIGHWTLAQTINLAQNKFEGSTIPTEVGMISTLTSFFLTSSSIKGSLPTELFSILSLQDFEAEENYLTGTLPSQIGQLLDLSKFASASRRDISYFVRNARLTSAILSPMTS